MGLKQVYQPGEPVKCPACGRHPDTWPVPAEDYVVPNREGEASRTHDQCGWCETKFTAWKEGNAIKLEWEHGGSRPPEGHPG